MAIEIPSEARIKKAIADATHLERINSCKSPEEVLEMPEQFGNNLYLFFRAITQEGEPDPDDMFTIIYLAKEKELGEPFQHFKEENGKLLADIKEALKEEAIYKEILKIHDALFLAGCDQKSNKLSQKIDPNLGIAAIGIPIWRKLNVLLRQATEAMKKVGIDPTQLYS